MTHSSYGPKLMAPKWWLKWLGLGVKVVRPGVKVVRPAQTYGAKVVVKVVRPRC